MQREAEKSLKKLIENPYNRQNFVNFLLRVFPEADVWTQTVKDLPIDEKFKDKILEAEVIGEYQEEEIAFLAVKVSSPEKLRKYHRDFVARYLEEEGKEGALVAFYSDSSSTWRLSFVRKEYYYDENGRVNEKLTSYKRYSFIVGQSEPIHTAYKQLVSLNTNPKIDELLEAFSVEPVTKEFYAELRNIFDKMWREIYKTNKHTLRAVWNVSDDELEVEVRAFTKRLLGRILFLYFVQKKGWLGAPRGHSVKEGDKRFLYNKFLEYLDTGKNFYRDFLEILFFKSLNTPPQRAGDFYRKELGCQIPFLNGGLFERDYPENIQFVIDNSLFNELFNVLERFNFTVKEDEPYEKEVAVDPEMLGKIFENLLEENYRKGSGAYYTPREIVYYMARKSLVYYLSRKLNIPTEYIESLLILEDLNTLEAKFPEAGEEIIKRKKEIIATLKNLKVVDPAVGSGAFPMGLLLEMVRLIKILEENIDEYKLKKELIQNCIYGVDKDPSAVDIARLRFWLSLIVDHELEEIEPLPNLDYKLMQGDSLVEEIVLGDVSVPLNFGDILVKRRLLQPEQQRLFEIKSPEQGKLPLEIEIINDKIEELKELHHKLFDTWDLKQKKKLKEKIERIEKEVIEVKLSDLERMYKGEVGRIQQKLSFPNVKKSEKKRLEKQLLALYKRLEAVNNFRENLRKEIREYFFWELCFPEVFIERGGFDIVIANPPYVGEAGHGDLLKRVRVTSFGEKYGQGKMDYFHFFLQKAIHRLSNRNSIISFITTNYYFQGAGASKLRESIQENTDILELIDFNELRLFESATGQHNAIIFLGKPKKGTSTLYVRFSVKEPNVERSLKIVEKVLLGKLEDDNKKLAIKFRTDYVFDRKGYIVPLSQEKGKLFEAILKELEKGAVYLEDSDLTQGIVMPQDFVTKRHLEILGNTVSLGDGIFVLSQEELESLNLTEKEFEEIIRPYYTTEELDVYCGDSKNRLWIIYATKRNINKKYHPNILRHLRRFKKILETKRETQQGKLPWYSLHWPRDEFFFKGEKIISRRMTRKPHFTYTDFDCYVSQTFFVIKPRSEALRDVNLKYLTLIFNSKLAYWWFYHFGKRKGEQLQIDKEPLMAFPIKVAEEQSTISKLLDIICCIRKSMIGDFEEHVYNFFVELVDIIVYELYFSSSMNNEYQIKSFLVDSLSHLEDKVVIRDVLELYHRLNSSESPVRNRITLMKVHHPLVSTIERRGEWGMN